MKLPQSRMNPAHVVALYVNAELTMEEIGRRYGVTRERIRQVLAEQGVVGRKEHERRRRQIRRAQRAALVKKTLEQCLTQMQRAIDENRRCVVCNAWVIREASSGYSSTPHGGGVARTIGLKTCSPECSEWWRKGGRYLYDDVYEQHRVTQAKSILRRPERYKDSQVEWAKRMLSDNAPPPNRRYVIPGSWLSGAADQRPPMMSQEDERKEE